MNVSTTSYENDSTDTYADLATQPDFGLPGLLAEGVLLVVALVACFLNGIVFSTLSELSDEQLKVRFLLQNSLIADMLLAVSLGSRIFLQVLKASRVDVEKVNMCGILAYNVLGYFCTFFQILASMAVAIDRFRSVLRPLEYHTTKYGKRLKAAVISATWGISVALVFPIVALRISPGEGLIDACYKAFGDLSWTQVILPTLLLSGVLITICTYLGIFVMIMIYRRKKRALGEGTADSENIRKRQLSMTLTFFLIHITYITLYVPGALYFSDLSKSVESDPVLDYYLAQAMTAIYLLNCVIDPFIYIIRIRIIRDHLRKKFGRNRGIKTDDDLPGKHRSTAETAVIGSTIVGK